MGKRPAKPKRDVVTTEPSYQCGWTGEWLRTRSRWCPDCKQHTPVLTKPPVTCQTCHKALDEMYETVWNPD